MKARELRQTPALAASVRNLLYYVHQNFLVVVELLLSRTPSSIENVLTHIYSTEALGLRTSKYRQVQATEECA